MSKLAWCDRCFDPIIPNEMRFFRTTNGRSYVICQTCERKEREADPWQQAFEALGIADVLQELGKLED